MPAVRKITARTKATWDDYLFNDKMMKASCRMIPPITWYILLPFAFDDKSAYLLQILLKICLIYLIITALMLIKCFLDSLYEISSEHEALKNRPLKGIYQMINLISIGVGIILIISVLIDRNATAILTGLGASAAILMLIFKDSILGLVAGVQLSANDMLRPGDWITMAKYGADGMRMAMLISSSAGNDVMFDEALCEQGRNFGNKIWNAYRLVNGWTTDPAAAQSENDRLAVEWFDQAMGRSLRQIAEDFRSYRISEAFKEAYRLFWDDFSGLYLEMVKPAYGQPVDAETFAATCGFFDELMRVLHPFMPFITEEIYQALPGSAETIMNEKWPGDENMKVWAEDCADFEKLMDYIKAVRAMRAEMNVHPAKKTSMVIETASPAAFEKGGAYLARFAFATDVTVTAKYEGSTDGMVNVATPDAKGFIPMMELIDHDKELARLNKELTKAEKELGMFTNQLNNPKFVEKAPAKLVEETRAKLAAAQDKAAKIKESIAALG